MNSIFHRISVRRYQDRPVEKEKILAILKAAMQAPSATNQQPWEFFVVTDRTMLVDLSKACPYGKMVATAPVATLSLHRMMKRLSRYFTLLAFLLWFYSIPPSGTITMARCSDDF